MTYAHHVLSHRHYFSWLRLRFPVSFHVVRHTYQAEGVNKVKKTSGQIGTYCLHERACPDTPLQAVKSGTACWELLLLVPEST